MRRKMGNKRIHTIEAKRGHLIAKWGRPERGELPSIIYAHGAGGADRTDARVLSDAFEGMKNCFGNTLTKELEDRGFDLTTLTFSIAQKEPEA